MTDNERRELMYASMNSFSWDGCEFWRVSWRDVSGASSRTFATYREARALAMCIPPLTDAIPHQDREGRE
jgi:hypothetical protein